MGDFFELRDEGCAFARLDKSFCREARRLVVLGVEFQACIERDRWDALERARGSYWASNDKTTFRVDVGVYSPRHHADKIGDMLLRSGIFLQHPKYNHGLEDYYNPQILELDGFEEGLDEATDEPDDLISAPVVLPWSTGQNESRPPANTSDQVEVILDSLSHTSILHEIRTDTNLIKSDLMRSVRVTAIVGSFKVDSAVGIR